VSCPEVKVVKYSRGYEHSRQSCDDRKISFLLRELVYRHKQQSVGGGDRL